MDDVIVVEDTTLEILDSKLDIVVVEAGQQGPAGIAGNTGPQGSQGDPGPQGPQGIPGSGDLTYHHSQAIASATWVITHNLGKYPAVVIIDSGGTEVVGSLQYDSINQVTITFTASFAGDAYLN